MPTKQADPVVKNKIVTVIPEPPMFKVIFLNDDYTSMEFVIEVLRRIFEYSFEDASNLTQEIHEQGSAVVAVLPFEIAEQKSAETALFAKANKFPLQSRIEPDA